MAGDYKISVSYQSIESAIQNFKSNKNKLQSAIDNMRKAMSTVDSNWNGTASAHYVNTFFSIYNNLMTSNETMDQSIAGLQTAVEEYRGAESTITSMFDSVEMAENPFQ